MGNIHTLVSVVNKLGCALKEATIRSSSFHLRRNDHLLLTFACAGLNFRVNRAAKAHRGPPHSRTLP